MKKLVLSVFAAAMMIMPSLAQSLSTKPCLYLKGFVKDSYGPIKNATIELYQENKKIETFRTSSSGRFQFSMIPDHQYTLEVTSGGYVTERISVNTYMPQDRIENNVLNIFDFDMILEERAKFTSSTEVFDWPVALIFFNPDIETFDYSAKYDEVIRKEWLKSRSASSMKSNKKFL